MTFTEAVEFVLSIEGGYSDDPRDAGGETNFGISKRSYPDLDIKGLTREQAIEIYFTDYWNHCRCDMLPDGVDLLVFDMAVNQGVFAAARALQKSVGTTADGVVGSATIMAAHQKTGLLVELLARRMHEYSQAADVKVFGLGWFRRVAKVAEKVLDVRLV